MSSKSVCSALLVGALCGCGSQFVPRVAVEGTTAMIAIPYNFDVGYGRRVAQDPQALLGGGGGPDWDPNDQFHHLEDPQRGEMIFTLIDNVKGNKMLPLRWITRVALDEASMEALDTTGSLARSQVVAFVDVPLGVVDDGQGQRDLEIRLDRYRRSDGTPPGPFQLIQQSYFASFGIHWTGWGKMDNGWPEHFIPITIRDAHGLDAQETPQTTEHFTPLEGWAGTWNCDWFGCFPLVKKEPNFNTLKDDYVPNPEFAINRSGGGANPAAWELEFKYPSHLMSILGVRLERENPSGAFVALDRPLPTATVSCASPQSAAARVMVVDPDARTTGVSVVFKLANTGASGCAARIKNNDLPITAGSIRAYNANGVALSNPTFTISVGS